VVFDIKSAAWEMAAGLIAYSKKSPAYVNYFLDEIVFPFSLRRLLFFFVFASPYFLMPYGKVAPQALGPWAFLSSPFSRSARTSRFLRKSPSIRRPRSPSGLGPKMMSLSPVRMFSLAPSPSTLWDPGVSKPGCPRSKNPPLPPLFLTCLAQGKQRPIPALNFLSSSYSGSPSVLLYGVGMTTLLFTTGPHVLLSPSPTATAIWCRERRQSPLFCPSSFSNRGRTHGGQRGRARTWPYFLPLQF